jgi:hypothetical protein
MPRKFILASRSSFSRFVFPIHYAVEVTGWALVPMVLSSALLLVGYWCMFRQGRRLLSRALAHIEQRDNITIEYTQHTVKLIGKLSAWQRLKLEVAVLLLHMVAYFSPLLIIGCVVMGFGGYLESLVVWMMSK